MAFSSKTVSIASIAIAGLSLVGVGAHASFTSTATASQTISTGSTTIEISGLTVTDFRDEGSGVDQTVPDGATSLNLNDYLPTGALENLDASSGFDYGYALTVTNTGSLSVDLTCALVAGTDDDADLAKQIFVDGGSDDTSSLDHYETQHTDVCHTDDHPTATLAPGASTTVSVELNGGNFTNSVQGESVSPTLTFTSTEHH